MIMFMDTNQFFSLSERKSERENVNVAYLHKVIAGKTTTDTSIDRGTINRAGLGRESRRIELREQGRETRKAEWRRHGRS